jgi:3-deoxy-manno-octulosonate cytidylyltransferase (CMP-KDO synthetase)
MKVLGIIPARMAASRFPGKPLKLINGIPMIGHCYYRTKLCDVFDEIYVATCDMDIFNYVQSIGGKAIMTSDRHERATERTAEALLKIEKTDNSKFDIVVMIQGDEPLVYPEMLDQIVEPFLNKAISISNLMVKLDNIDDINSADTVKVVMDKNKNALYMSREAIPSSKNFNKSINYFRQLGLIAFRRKILLDFITFSPSKLEIIESVDMNRFLENNIPIHMVETKLLVDAVDTPKDLIRVEKLMKKDNLFRKYS